jgi:DGQHR domain-containing protein
MNSINDIYDALRVENDFSFVGIIGKEGDRQTFTINIPFEQVPLVFKPVPYNPESQLLIQRETHRSRISNLKTYLKDPLACLPAGGSIVEKLTYELIVDNAYLVTLPKGSFRYLFDGQARLGAIEQNSIEFPKSKNDTFTIKLILSLGVTKDNQLFTDWNSAGTSPNSSICKAMDSRELLNRFTRDIIQDSEMLSSYIDFTKASVPTTSKSSKLWTLNQFCAFITILTGVTAASAETILADPKKQAHLKAFVLKFFSVLGQHPQLSDVFSGEMKGHIVRNELIVGNSVWLKSIGILGKVIFLHMITNNSQKADWSILDGLSAIDFSRKNPEWKGRCLSYRDKFEDKAFNHKAVCSYLIQSTRVPLPLELETIEEEVMLERSAGLKMLREANKAKNEEVVDV